MKKSRKALFAFSGKTKALEEDTAKLPLRAKPLRVENDSLDIKKRMWYNRKKGKDKAV